MNESDANTSLDSRLEASRSRLGQALDRLEKVVAARMRDGDQSAELARLSTALAAADRRNQLLTGRSDRVAQSLDRTIERLNAILEG